MLLWLVSIPFTKHYTVLKLESLKEKEIKVGNDRRKGKLNYFAFFFHWIVNFWRARTISCLCHRTSCSKYLLNGVVTPSNVELLCCLAESITLSCMPQCDFTVFYEKEENKIKNCIQIFKNNFLFLWVKMPLLWKCLESLAQGPETVTVVMESPRKCPPGLS